LTKKNRNMIVVHLVITRKHTSGACYTHGRDLIEMISMISMSRKMYQSIKVIRRERLRRRKSNGLQLSL